jgi:ribose/xylose/arabinose/galactoside ABC-type transport system permease subunit
MAKLKINKNRCLQLGGTILDQFTLRRWIVPLILIVVYFIVYSSLFPRSFLSAYNLSSMALEFAIPLSFVTVGMAIMLISGEIDLSVGYAVMFGNMMAGFLVINKLPLAVCIVVPIVTTGLMGYIVGLLVARIGINSFIATLGSGMVFYGLGLIIYEICRTFDGGQAIIHLGDWFIRISQAKLISFPDTGALQTPVLYSALLILVAVILTSKFRYFRKFYYIGINKEAAMLSGIDVKSMKAVSFMISSALAGTAGVLMCARMGAAVPLMGIGFELKAITACVIGGVGFTGGKGTIGGAILGGLFMICLSNGLRIAYAPSNIYRLIEGSVLLLAVIADAMMSRRKVIG